MTPKPVFHRAVPIAVALTLVLSLDASAQTLIGNTRILTIYCPSDAEVIIDGFRTETTGPVRQYKLTYGTSHRMQVEITGRQGVIEKYVKKTVILAHDQFNYEVRFDRLLAAAKKKNKKDNDKKNCDCEGDESDSESSCNSSDECAEVKLLKMQIAQQDKTIEEIKKEIVGVEKEWNTTLNETLGLKIQGPPLRISAAEFDAAKLAITSARAVTVQRKQQLEAVTELVLQEEVRIRALDTEVQLRTRNTVASRNAIELRISSKSKLSGLQLRVEQGRKKLADAQAAVPVAEEALNRLSRHNRLLDQKQYEKKLDDRNTKLNVLQIKKESAGNRLADAKKQRAALLEQLHRVICQPKNSDDA